MTDFLQAMTEEQRIAIAHPCLLGEETMHPRFGHKRLTFQFALTVNSGYE